MTEVQGFTPRSVIPGTVVQPTAVIDPKSESAFSVANVMRKLVQNSGAYHSEKDQDAALEAINAWEKAQVTSASMLDTLRAEHHSAAPKEDVTLRRAAVNGLPQPVAGERIDYNRLAAAIAQKMLEAQQTPQDVVPA